MSLRSLSLSGLSIALVGFLLTRFTVTLAAGESAMQFLFAGIIPLVLGLSLAAYGVVLTVGTYDRALVRTTALWCLLGTGTMALLVVLTILGTQPELMNAAELRKQTYLSNFLIGGAVGGTLTGLYAARNRQQRRELKQQANRLVLLNRLLRDQVINAATAIKGHSGVLSDQHSQSSVDVIDKQAQNVIDTVENIKYLSNTADRSELMLGSVDLVSCLEEEIDHAKAEYPHAVVDWSPPDEAVSVRANAQISEVFAQLLSNAIEYTDAETPRVGVSIETSLNDVRVTVSDTGSGLPDDQQALLERGEIAEFDDPTTGFGLNIVRLLVESFDGGVETTVDEGTEITIRLPRIAVPQSHPYTASRSVTAPGVTPSRIGLAVSTALVAGATMGIAMVATGGEVPVIGALYGIESTVVGLITHEFHSVVFGLVYAGILSAGSQSFSAGLKHRVLVGLVLAVSLWLIAAGLVMPIWLQLAGIEASLPNLTVPSLIGHLVWGLTLGTLYHYGEGWLDKSELPGRFELDGLWKRAS